MSNLFIGSTSIPFGQNVGTQKLRKEDITLSFLLARQVLDTYKIEFLINMALDGYDINNYRKPDIDMKSLEDSVLANLSSVDREYLIINKLDFRKVVFYFNFEKWFKDAMANTKPKINYGKFNREISFKKQVPKVILYDIMRGDFGNFLEKKFKNYITKKRLDSRWFRSVFKNKKIRTSFSEMFNYSYNFQFNKMIMSLKPTYLMLMILGYSSIQQARSKIGNNFDNEVRKKIKNAKFNKKMF